MKGAAAYFCIILIMCFFSFSACEDEASDLGSTSDYDIQGDAEKYPQSVKLCDPGSTRDCYCPDGSVTQQSCNNDGKAWGACEDCTAYTVWCDNKTDLCWQDPQKDAYNEVNTGVSSLDAKRYCDELVLGGYSDWRLPTITELRSIIDGNNMTEDGGLCYVKEGSKMNDRGPLKWGITHLLPCMGKMQQQLEGPDESGCYWKDELSGNCDRVDPASPSHHLEYWSSTVAQDDPDNWAAYVFFDFAAVGFNHSQSFAEVRCVRDAPSRIKMGPKESCVKGTTKPCTCDNKKTGAMVCSATSSKTSAFGPCDCTDFEPSPRPEDVCGECDQIKVKISLSKELDKQPYMLSAFLYRQGEIFMRPPDVGSFENGILYPDIDKDKPYTMTIPGCSYYRDRCMEGDYYLVVYLKMNEGIFPGMPELADMVWVNFHTIKLEGDGSNNYEFEVEAVPMIQSPMYMLFYW